MEMKLSKLKLYKYINLKFINFQDFVRKYNLKNETMNEAQLQRVQKNSINLRDSKIYSDKGFVNIDNDIIGGTHWV